MMCGHPTLGHEAQTPQKPGFFAIHSLAKKSFFSGVLPFDRPVAPAYTPRPRRTRVMCLRSALFLMDDGFSSFGTAL